MSPRVLTFNLPANDALFVSPHRLVCYEWGNSESPHTVVCVHGLTRNGRDFDFLALALSQNFRVLSFDIAGRGLSDWLVNPLGYSYPGYIADLQQAFHQLNLSRAHWVGTSMGGILGMMVANAVPGFVQSLTLNDVGCLIPAAGLRRILSYAGVKMHFASREEAEATLRDICRPFGITDERHWQHLFAHSLQPASDGGVRFAYDPAIVSSFPKIEAVSDINLWGLWPGLQQTPVLLIRGAQSDILTRDTALLMQSQHSKFTLYEVAGAGHAPALMADDQIQTVRKWLGQLAQT